MSNWEVNPEENAEPKKDLTAPESMAEFRTVLEQHPSYDPETDSVDPVALEGILNGEIPVNLPKGNPFFQKIKGLFDRLTGRNSYKKYLRIQRTEECKRQRRAAKSNKIQARRKRNYMARASRRQQRQAA